MNHLHGGKENATDCSAIFRHLNKINSDYCNKILELCASEMLSDMLGLTVIYPDESFIKKFVDMDDGRDAKRVLSNTIFKRYFPSADSWDEFMNKGLPTRGNADIRVEKIDGDRVILNNDVILEQDKTFKNPKNTRYAVWKVVSGEFTTSMEPRVRTGSKKNKHYNKNKKMDEISGGSNNKILVNIANMLKSENSIRAGILRTIINKSDDLGIKNTILVHMVSLYNWLGKYHNDVLTTVLPITDINPGTTLVLHLLDPHSLITTTMLMGSNNESDPTHIKYGWNLVELTDNPIAEWKQYINKARELCDDAGCTKPDVIFSDLISVRNDIIKKTRADKDFGLDGIIRQTYQKYMSGGKIYPDKTYKAMYEGDKFRDRKLWQDQLRYIYGMGLRDTDIYFVAESNIHDVIDNAIAFAPKDNYNSQCEFLKVGNWGERYVSYKWIFSTDFMYVPVNLNDSIFTKRTGEYTVEDKFEPFPVLNNYIISLDHLNTLSNIPYKPVNMIYYREWNSVGGLGSYQAPGYQQGNSNDFSYGEVGVVGQNAEPGMYGETYQLDKNNILKE